MSTMGRSLIKTAKNSLTDAIAQTVISLILTLGFVLIQILAGMGFFIEGMYSEIMVWYGPMTAIVISFYFGVYITKRNGNGTTPVATPDNVTRTLEALINSAQSNTTAAAHTQNMVSEIAVSINALGKIIIPIMKLLATTAETEVEESEPEVQEDQTPKKEELI